MPDTRENSGCEELEVLKNGFFEKLVKDKFRNKVADHMRDNPEKFNPIIKKEISNGSSSNVKDYIDKMVIFLFSFFTLINDAYCR